MSEDVSAPIPDFPGQDPESPIEEPHTDGYGFSGTPDSGYELDGDGDGAGAGPGDGGGDVTPAEPGAQS